MKMEVLTKILMKSTKMYNRENDLYNFSKRNVHFSPFFRGSSSSLEYHLKGF